MSAEYLRAIIFSFIDYQRHKPSECLQELTPALFRALFELKNYAYALPLRLIMTKDPYTFQCTQCGNCCRGDGFVYVKPREVRQMACELGMNLIDFELKYLGTYNQHQVLRSQRNSDCVFLRQSRCMVHDVKPEQCTKWPFWPELFQVREVFEEAKEYCEGLKDFTFEDFQKSAVKPHSLHCFEI